MKILEVSLELNLLREKEKSGCFFFSSPFSPSRLSSNKTSIVDIRTFHTYVNSEFSLVCHHFIHKPSQLRTVSSIILSY